MDQAKNDEMYTQSEIIPNSVIISISGIVHKKNLLIRIVSIIF